MSCEIVEEKSIPIRYQTLDKPSGKENCGSGLVAVTTSDYLTFHVPRVSETSVELLLKEVER